VRFHPAACAAAAAAVAELAAGVQMRWAAELVAAPGHHLSPRFAATPAFLFRSAHLPQHSLSRSHSKHSYPPQRQPWPEEQSLLHQQPLTLLLLLLMMTVMVTAIMVMTTKHLQHRQYPLLLSQQPGVHAHAPQLPPLPTIRLLSHTCLQPVAPYPPSDAPPRLHTTLAPTPCLQQSHAHAHHRAHLCLSALAPLRCLMTHPQAPSPDAPATSWRWPRPG